MAGVIQITETERAEREDRVRRTIGHLRIEGMDLDSEARSLFDRYVEGELSMEELGAAIHALNDRDFGPVRLPRD